MYSWTRLRTLWNPIHSLGIFWLHRISGVHYEQQSPYSVFQNTRWIAFPQAFPPSSRAFGLRAQVILRPEEAELVPLRAEILDALGVGVPILLFWVSVCSLFWLYGQATAR